MLFRSLMIDDNEPFVIEYNCRMGDPETEVVIPRIENDLVELFLATSYQTLHSINLQIIDKTAVGIVAVAGGYPGEYKKGDLITGLGNNIPDDKIVFHSGTKYVGGNIVTNGGRVLVSVSFDDNTTAAAKKASETLNGIHFENMNYRSDIGYEFK